MYFHRTVQDRTATVWRRCSVAVDLSLTIGVAGLTLRGGQLIRSDFFLKNPQQNLAKKFVKPTVR